VPAAAVLVLVSSQTGFSIHSRYILPFLPFAFVWCSKIARSLQARHWPVAGLCCICLCWSIGSSLWTYPHSLSYFNALAGGPMRGHAHLLDSNIAWGQDLYFLKRWYGAHPEARPFHLAYYGLLDPRLVGIEFSLPPVGPGLKSGATRVSPDNLGPFPGWYAVDMNHLHGSRLTAHNGSGQWQNVARNGCDLTYFLRFHPIATAGYSIYVYHVTLEEANRVRRELGLHKCPAAKAGCEARHQSATRQCALRSAA